jgi:hypothetical protein
MPATAGKKRKHAPAKGKATGKKRPKASEAPGPTRTELDGKGLTELRALCTAAKLPSKGGKDAIVRRLLEYHGTMEIDSLSSKFCFCKNNKRMIIMSRSPSPVMGSSKRDDTGRLKVGPNGSVNLTPSLLRDLGFIDQNLCALAEKCDNPRYAADALVGIIIFREGTGSIDLRSPGSEMLTSRRVTRTPITLPRSGGSGGDFLVSGGILGSYAAGCPDRPQVINLLHHALVHVEVKGPGFPLEVNRALFAEAFDYLLDHCVVNAVPAELLSTVLSRSPSKSGRPGNPLKDPETKEKDDQGSQAQYMARLKKVGSEMYVDMTKVSTSKIYTLLFKGVGGDDPATVYIPQDPACALEVMRSLHCPTTGNRNTDNIGEGLLVEAGKTSRAEMTQTQLADMSDKFQRETLAESKHKAHVLVNTMYVACYGVQNRLPRAIVDEYKATVDRLSEQPGITAHKFRQVLLQGEMVRTKAVNDGLPCAGDLTGLQSVSISGGYRLPIDRMEACIMNHAVEYAGQPKQGARGRDARGPAADNPAPDGGAKDGGKKGRKRDRDAGKRTAYARLPDGMGSGHNDGKPCTNPAHDPSKGGHVCAVCSFSHVHWDASLEPSQADIAIAVALAK